MCAIIDANVLGELWDQTGNPAGQGFRTAIENGRIQLVIGGTQLKRELEEKGHRRMKLWIQQLSFKGSVTRMSDVDVDRLANVLRKRKRSSHGFCQSDDQHVIALAQISGARLLYTNDDELTQDFGNRNLIDEPRGKVYSTRVTNTFSKARRHLVNDRGLCRKQ